MKSFISRALLTTAATGVAATLAAGVASAHVTVEAPGATQGGYSVLTFKVPTESDTASTTKLTVQLPEFKSARPEPIPGWQSTVEKNADQEATSVTWTADPGAPGIPPGYFQRFALSVGPLPAEEELSFATTQTYSDSKVVAWDQPETPSGDEPEHPVPTMALADGMGADHHGGAAVAAHHMDAMSDESDEDSVALWLGGIALVLGAVGAVFGIGAYVRGRRQ